DDTSYLETLDEEETEEVFTAAADIDLDIVSRARWGADETLGSSTYTADEVHLGVVHHTAHASGDKANSYTREESPGIMRAMYQYHTKTLGWADIGYNVVVDRFGTVYEGRKGGFENGVIGAHARGFNTGSFGVSVMGNFYDVQASPAAIESLTDVIALKSAIHGIDPGAFTSQMGDGTWRPTIVGHRDVGQTACPGLIYELLPQIREEAREMAVRFPDVPADSPHRTSVVELAADGVTKGCRLNEFCPKDGLNRAQASTFVLQALELDPIPGSQFSDVPEDGTHAGAINALVERGWLIGYDDDTFGPWDKLTRGQLATLLARSAGQPLIVPPSDPYPDVDKDSTHAPGITALSEMGIRGECGGGNFCPNDIALRDSTATFVNEVRKRLP
ncbi:MAG: N-acetylmuramoyl-L-alanine amidase, partial [Nitriliruptoraceae bacterium]